MSVTGKHRGSRLAVVWMGAIVLVSGVILATPPIFQMTQDDFRLPGTQIGEVTTATILSAQNCRACHGGVDPTAEPYATWQGSLMGQAGRDPLFFAQMALANQDVANVGTYCLRCHVPSSYVSGHAAQPTGATLDNYDREGMSCHLCHSMVDPQYRPGVSPTQDQGVLAGLSTAPPPAYGNAMFVLDPTGLRRGPRSDGSPLHATVQSAFHTSGNFCGTCHDVGNVATVKQADGSYQYNALGLPAGDLDPAHQFPLERTFSEWKLSAFANGGVDMGGRFGGSRGPVVSTCQDCHMPRTTGRLAIVGNVRTDAATHEFAGAAAQVLDLIAEYTRNDPSVNQAHLATGRAKAVSMLQRAASLELTQTGAQVNVRVLNQSGHKIPTGHIEGRRIWVNVRFLDSSGSLIAERGTYDTLTAELDEASTTVFEMRIGLSDDAAALTGLPPGETPHMSLANTIVKDNRIPPRGFNNTTYAAAGAPSVGANYADGQHWADVSFGLPQGAVRVEARLLYQNTPKAYILHLRDHNHTDDWGNILYQAWNATGRGAPIEMVAAMIDLMPAGCNIADVASLGGQTGPDGMLTPDDVITFLNGFFSMNLTVADIASLGGQHTPDGALTADDLIEFLTAFFAGCP